MTIFYNLFMILARVIKINPLMILSTMSTKCLFCRGDLVDVTSLAAGNPA